MKRLLYKRIILLNVLYGYEQNKNKYILARSFSCM